jgi:DHA1 family bicyclomycin/chloramphenicol resistance-like MFS transporter
VFGVQASSFLARRVGPQWILFSAIGGMLISATAIVVLDQLNAGLVGILIPLWFFILSCGFALPMLNVLALANHGGEAATAASLLGAVNFGLAGAISPVVGAFGISAHTMGMVMMATSLTSVVLMLMLIRPWSTPPLTR